MSDAKVLFDYDAEADDELTLKEGDFVRNIEKKEDGWWEGELHGKRGMFPENFVEEIKKPVPVTESKPPPEKNVVNEKNSMARVTFDYEAENDDELNLTEGDMVKVLDQEEEGWWKGELNGKIGVFPSNFVELVKGPPPGAADAQPEPEPPKEPPKEPVTGEKRAKMIGGIGMGLTQDALSKVKLKSANGAGGNKKPDKPSSTPSELDKRLSMGRNPPKLPEQERPPKPASKGKERVVVEFDYAGEQSDELTLHVGDVVTIIEKDVNEGWSKGELNGKIGLFPDNFVKILPPEQPKKEPMPKSKSTSDLSKKPPPPVGDDSVDAKPNRPDFPKLKKTSGDRPPPPNSVNQTEIPVKLKPVSNPADDITKKSEPPPLPDSKPTGNDERPKPPVKKSPPSLPKKPDKSRPPLDLPLNSDRPHARHLNGMDKDPMKRHSAVPIPSDKPFDSKLKRHSQGAELGVNLNDIKSSAVLQPLTSDRPKNPAKNPPTKYGGPRSPKKTVTPEIPQAPWALKEDKEIKKPVPEKPLAADKPPKPAIPDTTKPSVKPMVKPEPKADSVEVKRLQDEINTLKNTLQSLAKQFEDQVQKSDKRLQRMEKKFTDEIEDLTKELDEEKKLRSAVDVEVNRLRKLIKNQMAS